MLITEKFNLLCLVEVVKKPVLPNVRPLGALRPFEPIFKGFTPPLRPYAP